MPHCRKVVVYDNIIRQLSTYYYGYYLNYDPSRKPLILCVEKQLIGEHLQEILDKGMWNMAASIP